MGRLVRAALTALMAATTFVVTACGSNGPSGPTPPPGGGGNQQPPVNNPPIIESLTVRNPRVGAPADFADVSDAIEIAAQVRDDETPVDRLQFQWSASNGMFSGAGATVIWNPDAAAQTPVDVPITLRVIERYGHPGGSLNWEHSVSRTVSARLHHSDRELGAMAERFLTEFSKPQSNKDWQDVMRDFKGSACPDAGEVEVEKEDVIRHYTYFVMHEYRIEPAAVALNFRGTCAYPPPGRRGDACVAIPVYWDSTDTRNGSRRVTTGTDHLTAAYSPTDGRWWLCSSYLQGANTLGHTFYSSR